MLTIQSYSSFIAAILIFQMIPGPGTLTIIQITARHGIHAGMAAVLGTLLGDAIYMLAAALGLAAILQTTPMLLQALQYVGIAYLIWMGWGVLRSVSSNQTRAIAHPISHHHHLRRALTVTLTNPKAILFFVAFFPLFIAQDAHSVTLLVMMLHVSVLSLLYQTGLVLIGNWLAQRLRHLPIVARLASQFAGVALIGFGIKLAVRNSS